MKRILSLLISLAAFMTAAFVVPVSAAPTQPSPPVLNAHNAILIDTVNMRPLYEKAARERVAIASTTKIMTAILAIENSSLDDIVTISGRAAAIGGSTAHLDKDEKIRMEDLLYCLMLKSGNDAAIAIAEHIGGTVENFAEMMTAKAKEIGAMDTSYKSPHGLDSEGHYSTAYDLALITVYALKKPEICKIVDTKSITVAGGKYLENTNEMLSLYPYADGVKTGYTGDAGRCLVTSATKNGIRLISVILNAPTRKARADSSKKLLEYGFNNYNYYAVVQAGEEAGNIELKRATAGSVGVVTSGSFQYIMTAQEFASIKKSAEIFQPVVMPVNEGSEVGTLNVMLGENVIAKVSLVASGSARKLVYADYLGFILKGISEIFTSPAY